MRTRLCASPAFITHNAKRRFATRFWIQTVKGGGGDKDHPLRVRAAAVSLCRVVWGRLETAGKNACCIWWVINVPMGSLCICIAVPSRWSSPLHCLIMACVFGSLPWRGPATVVFWKDTPSTLEMWSILWRVWSKIYDGTRSVFYKLIISARLYVSQTLQPILV